MSNDTQVVLTDTDLQLAKDSAILLNAAISQVPSEKVQAVKAAVEAELAALEGAPKATLPELGKAVVNVAKDVAHEINNPKATNLVNDFADLADDALDQAWFNLLGDAIHIGKDIRAFKKG